MTTTNSSVPDIGKKSVNRGKPFITFRIGKDLYGVHIALVKEVVQHLPLTRIPRAPDYMPGIINLRGGVITVVDLGMRLGLDGVLIPAEAYIIVIEILHEDQKYLLGLQVDLVEEVVKIDPTSIDVSPRIGALVASEYVEGIALRGDNFITILNLERAFDFNELVNREKNAEASLSTEPETGVADEVS